ncbi:MAG: hypothetical protein RMJ19_06825, partial [Gemmatales bacterium]|nr:hypothetical protein [Gemmatales bacterium]MDW8175368.1 hypothetical protein [Gemmatales bacterium]
HLRNITTLPFGAEPRAKPPTHENSLLGNFAVGGARSAEVRAPLRTRDRKGWQKFQDPRRRLI